MPTDMPIEAGGPTPSDRRPVAGAWLRLALAVLLACAAGTALAQQDENCGDCHEDFAFDSPAHSDSVCTDCHVNVPPEHEDADLEPLTDEQACGDCHRRPGREIGRSDHAGETACADCHGDPHFIHEISDPASAVSPVNQIEVCGDCHEEPAELVPSFLSS
jgi:hypothetical protein